MCIRLLRVEPEKKGLINLQPLWGGWNYIKHMPSKWDYIEEIRNNGYVYQMNADTKFYLPNVETDAIQTVIARNEYYFEGNVNNLVVF